MWAFRARFRANAFGWQSQPAITRVRQAVAEITKAAKRDPMLGAEGAVLFIERVSPALAHVDSSSGAIGAAVNSAIAELASIIEEAPADTATREAWLRRLHAARAADGIPYTESLDDYWGDLCATKEIASRWADHEIEMTRKSFSPDRNVRAHYFGAVACLSALMRAMRYDELIELVGEESFWPYKHWALRALLASGRKAEALERAEASLDPFTSRVHIARFCESVLLADGKIDEAFARYATDANGGGTFLATYRTVAKKYPSKSPNDVLSLLVASTPGEEGKWFAAAKDARLFDSALALARLSPTDPRTLTRAARDHGETAPDFAVEAGVLALEWIARGHGYEITMADVSDAYAATEAAAMRLGAGDVLLQRLRSLVELRPRGPFVARALGIAHDGR